MLGFLAILVLIVAIGVYALGQIADVRQTTATIVSRDISVLRQLGQIRADQFALRDLRSTALVRLVAGAAGRSVPSDEDPVAAWRAKIDASENTMDEAIELAQTLQSQAIAPQRAAAWQSIAERLRLARDEMARLHSAGEAQMAAVVASDVDRALGAESAVREAREAMFAALTEAEDAMNEAIAAGQDRVSAVYEESRTSLLIGIGITGLLGLVIAFAIRHSVRTPLAAFMAFVDRVGTGDLGGQAAATGRDELGQLGTTLNGMVHGLRDLAVQSRSATENLNAAVAEIRASTQEQAASVEEQLAAVQETAATVDEITHAGSQIGKRAQEVIASAQVTAQTSMQGLEAVEETGRAMDAIREQAQAVAENIVALSEKTQAVGEIITTVNDISERSHLLALNAAIEAAAAGESGRSFAVVAAEMKLLADQAKEATTQVRSILGDIQRGINASVMLTEEAVKRVTAGKERADVTQRTIDEITGRVQESVNTFQQIVASTNQQQLGIEQVMSALANIRQASQQTAAGTRQLDSAAGNLAQLAEQLLGLSTRYRL
nr:methyl-accepting chemotaxis protein [Chthonobacter albigriseus]